MELLAQPKKNIVLDATTLTTLMSCARLADFRFNYHFQSIDGKSNSIECGSITHKILEVYYRERIKGFNHANAVGAALAAGNMYIQGCKYCTDFEPQQSICPNCTGKACPECCNGSILTKPECNHQPNEYPGVKNTPADSTTRPKRTGYRWVLETCEQYFDFYQVDRWVPLFVEEVKGKVLYEDDDIRILWKAKLDLGVDTNNGIYPVDHKTMQQNRSQLSLNNQFIGQCLLMESRTVIINKIGFQISLKPAEKFTRAVISYSADRLLEWQSEILPYWANFLVHCQETGYYPPNFTHCDGKFGWCQFAKDICQADKNMREEELKKGFIVGEPWDI